MKINILAITPLIMTVLITTTSTGIMGSPMEELTGSPNAHDQNPIPSGNSGNPNGPKKPLVEAKKHEVYQGYQGYYGLIEQLNDEVEFPESIMRLPGDTITLQILYEHFYVDEDNLQESDTELKENLTMLFNSANDTKTVSIAKKKFLVHLVYLYYYHGLHEGDNPESRLRDWIKEQKWEITFPN
ncbi:hypothetical protein IWQ61_010478 [Dispira simplex]|nr:hypothetical protein IWQ61_010478 [Dispira simplex]